MFFFFYVKGGCRVNDGSPLADCVYDFLLNSSFINHSEWKHDTKSIIRLLEKRYSKDFSTVFANYRGFFNDPAPVLSLPFFTPCQMITPWQGGCIDIPAPEYYGHLIYPISRRKK
jgi:hypothetical protein